MNLQDGDDDATVITIVRPSRVYTDDAARMRWGVPLALPVRFPLDALTSNIWQQRAGTRCAE